MEKRLFFNKKVVLGVISLVLLAAFQSFLRASASLKGVKPSAGLNTLLTPTPFFHYPIVPGAPISGYYDHDPRGQFVTFYDERKNQSINDGYWFFCSEKSMQDFVGCEEPVGGEASCPNNKELWYNGHTGTDYEYAWDWHESGEYSDQCHLDRFDSSDYRYVFAPAKGKIQLIQSDDFYNGNAIFIKHDLNGNGNYDDDKFRSAYLHFNSINPELAVNQIIDEGRLLGLGGMSGLASTPHLHFEVQRSTVLDFSTKWPVDPFGWLGAGEDPSPYDNYPLWRFPNVYLPITNGGPSDTFEPNDSFSTAYPIFPSLSYYSYIWTVNDTDWYRFSVYTGGGAKYISAYLQSIPPGTNYNVELWSPSNSRLAGSYQSGNSDETISNYWVDQGGEYRLKIYSVSGSSVTDSYRVFVRVTDAPQSGSAYP